MREIKFRGWINSRQQMIKLERTNGKYDFENGFVVSFVVDGYEEFGSHERFDLKSEDFILMQFTGLRDKNGKEIYEGDVVIQPKWVSVGQYLPATGEVKYLGVRFTVDCIGKWEGAHAELYGNSEVIGNIYENPELLTPTL